MFSSRFFMATPAFETAGDSRALFSTSLSHSFSFCPFYKKFTACFQSSPCCLYWSIFAYSYDCIKYISLCFYSCTTTKHNCDWYIVPSCTRKHFYFNLCYSSLSYLIQSELCLYSIENFIYINNLLKYKRMSFGLK